MQSVDYIVGPLTRIRILGTICPCLLSEEDAQANASYNSLSRLLTKKILYHKPPPPQSKESSSSNSSKSFFQTFTGILGGGSADDTTNVSSEKWKKIEARICIVNGYRNSIAMEIIPCDDDGDTIQHNDMDEECSDDDSETKALAKKASGNTIIIPFTKIGVVSAGTSGWAAGSDLVQVYGKQSQHNPSGKGDEIVRFALKEGVDKAEFIDLFMNLIHWDRSRKSFGEEEEDEEAQAEGNKKGYLKTKADKAAHFAKRELEMQQRKREREKRKAKYLKDTGGLKHVAIAMANMD